MPRTPISRTSAEPTLYEILSLTPKRLKGQDPTAQQKTIKQAYHKALLKHHPDKNPQDSPQDTSSSSPQSSQTPKSQSKSSSGGKSSSSPSSSSSSSVPKSELTYTIDQIQHAYSVLSDAGQRREYDRQLLLVTSTSSSSPSSHSFSISTEQKHSVSTRFHTGVETVDLDDLGFDERTGVYFGSCRCGNERGFQFTERQLEEYEEDLVLMVQCLDCSLWMRVLFDAVDEEEEDGGVNAPQQQQPAATTVSNRNQTRDAAEQRRGSHSVSRSGKGWRFNLNFKWGLSLSGSASAST
ncbi:hypothetical protein F5Y08DRAFT_295180 [Xylaria arbuscula]|nr:hypothetical protein F5Y08DRAFT_295180 [Xylaria arbuscula]